MVFRWRGVLFFVLLAGILGAVPAASLGGDARLPARKPPAGQAHAPNASAGAAGILFERQLTGYSCGLACLVGVSRYWNVILDQRQLLDSHPPRRQRDGYSIGELKAIARARRLRAFSSRADMDFLSAQLERRRPVIVALKIPSGPGGEFSHFVTVYSVNGNAVRAVDPLFGETCFQRDEFMKMWGKMRNAALLVVGHGDGDTLSLRPVARRPGDDPH